MSRFDRYYEPPDPPPDYRELSRKTVIARYQYPCFACRVPIEKGQKHVKVACLTDAGFEHYRTHIRCYNEYDE